jgi:hypothetical protein
MMKLPIVIVLHAVFAETVAFPSKFLVLESVS